MQESRYPLLLLVAPAVLLVLALFVYPLALSSPPPSPRTARSGWRISPRPPNFTHRHPLHLVIVGVSTALVAGWRR